MLHVGQPLFEHARFHLQLAERQQVVRVIGMRCLGDDLFQLPNSLLYLPIDFGKLRLRQLRQGFAEFHAFRGIVNGGNALHFVHHVKGIGQA